MYLSHPVRRMRDDPIDDEDVQLVIEASDEDARDDLEQRLESAGIEVEERLQFGSLLVEVEEATVADLCEFGGIETIETAGTLGTGNDHHADM